MTLSTRKPSKQQNNNKSISKKRGLLSFYLPKWMRQYQQHNLSFDIISGIVVGIIVIPQSLGYAVLAGLAPEYGLYAAIVPVLVYAWVGSSNIQAVGPVAITAIMTASSLADYADKGMATYASMASLLAIMVGFILWLAGRLRLGWIIQFISRGVSSGFISGAAVLIFISQIKYFTGISFSGSNVFEYVSGIYHNINQRHELTILVATSGFMLLLLNRFGKKWLWYSWLSEDHAKWMQRLFPLLLVIVFIISSTFWQWGDRGVKVIGFIPNGLPSFSLPYMPNFLDLMHLLPSAGLMALIAFVSSSSIARFYARKRDDSFNANSELTGLGLANFVGGFFQSFPISGGLSRTAISADSGAKTPLTSVVITLVMICTLMFLGYFISPLPYALLGATIMVSIIGLIDYQLFFRAWRVDRLDAINLAVTFFTVIVFGLNAGLIIGLLVSFASLIWQSSHPHIAIVGVLQGSEHFRNINRHNVQTFDKLLIMRIDESLFFGNSNAVYKQIYQAVKRYPNATDVVLIMSAVNHIDLTAQDMLIELNTALLNHQKKLHFSEVKGPVMDVIENTDIIDSLSGSVFLSTIQAVHELKYS